MKGKPSVVRPEFILGQANLFFQAGTSLPNIVNNDACVGINGTAAAFSPRCLESAAWLKTGLSEGQ
jgi:hypothetical protein